MRHDLSQTLIRHGSPARSPGWIAVCALASVVLLGGWGCRDVASDPMAVVLTEETRSALALGADLPALPDLLSDGDEETGEPAGAGRLWMDSWERGEPEGRELRRDAYHLAAPFLAEARGAEGATAVLTEVEEALESTSLLDENGLSPRITDGLERARALRRRGRAALSGGDVTGAFIHGLAASDALRLVGPRAVALELVERAERALRAADEDEVAAEDLRRARRLVQGARLAVEDEDWRRAIRRAYYAGQLLGASEG